METKVEVKTIPLHGLFIHRKQVWRSLGKLRAESHSTTAQKVFMNEHDTEVSTENADFIDGLKVTPYDGELPRISKYVGSISDGFVLVVGMIQVVKKNYINMVINAFGHKNIIKCL